MYYPTWVHQTFDRHSNPKVHINLATKRNIIYHWKIALLCTCIIWYWCKDKVDITIIMCRTQCMAPAEILAANRQTEQLVHVFSQSWMPYWCKKKWLIWADVFTTNVHGYGCGYHKMVWKDCWLERIAIPVCAQSHQMLHHSVYHFNTHPHIFFLMCTVQPN